MAVRELVQQVSRGTGSSSVLLTGYSGGAEFLSRHLARTGTGWMPPGSGVVFVGGGGIYGEQVTSPATGSGPRLTWIVGDRDGEGRHDFAFHSGDHSGRQTTYQCVEDSYVNQQYKQDYPAVGPSLLRAEPGL